jgi:hypothetical protein
MAVIPAGERGDAGGRQGPQIVAGEGCGIRLTTRKSKKFIACGFTEIHLGVNVFLGDSAQQIVKFDGRRNEPAGIAALGRFAPVDRSIFGQMRVPMIAARRSASPSFLHLLIPASLA